MYKNIVFDLGGVMVEWRPLDYLMERLHNSITEKHVYDLTFGSKYWAELDAGEISRFTASQAMLEEARKAGYHFEVQAVMDDWTSMLHTRHRVVELASKLKSRGYHLYYLSNIPLDILAMFRQRSFWRLFDGGIASCDVHLLKPQPEIYQKLLSTYSLDPEECVLIDDSSVNVKAARALGFTGITMNTRASGLAHKLAACGVELRRPKRQT